MTFLGFAVPVNDALKICWIYNWAKNNNFHIQNILQGIVSSSPLAAGRQQAVPVWLVYVSASEITFMDYFGEYYNDDILSNIPEMIQKIENDKKGGNNGRE